MSKNQCAGRSGGTEVSIDDPEFTEGYFVFCPGNEYVFAGRWSFYAIMPDQDGKLGNVVYARKLNSAEEQRDEAADEIEELRTNSEALQKIANGYTAEIERLRDALEAAHEYIDHATGVLPIIRAALSQKEGE